MSSRGSGGQVALNSSDGALAITEKVIVVIRHSFGFVVQWENIRMPSRFVLGSSDLRRLTIRIRQQPTNFMKTVHDSLATAQQGQTMCMRGSKTARVLLGEESHSDRERTEFTAISLQEIAAKLNDYTNSMHSQFRELRTDVMNVHGELNSVTRKRQRPDILARLSRSLSKDVRSCEAGLLRICQEIEEIEKSLNLMTRWWQKVAGQANYLLENGNSSLATKHNAIILKEIRDGFVKLDNYFEDYLDKVYHVYDENIGKLNEENQRELKGAVFRGERLKALQR